MLDLSNVLPQFIMIGRFPLATYGVITAFAIGTLYVLSRNKLKKLDISENNIDLIFIFAVVAGVIGGRIAYILIHLEEYSDIRDLFKIWEGGIHLFGVFFGAFCGVLVISTLLKKSLSPITDAIITYVPLAQALGRLGNLANLELMGTPTKLPWGIYLPRDKRVEQFSNFETFHPLFAYEIILNLINLGILHYLSKKNLNPGTLTAIYFFNYAVIRFFIEFLRVDTNEVALGLKLTQIICALTIVVTAVFIYRQVKSTKSLK